MQIITSIVLHKTLKFTYN